MKRPKFTTASHRRRRRSRRTTLAAAFALVAIAVGMTMTFGASAGATTAVTGAAFTTVNENADGTGHCKNGNPNVNCNIYDGKRYVWLNGGPSTAYVGDGSYFFAVLAPGGQADPNDGTAGNLSDDYDTYGDRTFSVSGGAVTYAGPHDLDSNKIRLMSYADTPNPGGVYILAICSLADGYPVTPSACKYDAFKIQEEGEAPFAQDLTITKDATGAYTNTYGWTISKDADKTTVKQIGGSATFTYTVNVTHDGGTIGDVEVTGTISVYDPNVDGQNATLPVSIDGVGDQLSDGTVCSVTNGGAQTLTQFQTDFLYECDLAAVPQSDVTNTATVTWGDQFLDDGSLLTGNAASFTFPSSGGIGFDENTIDECVDVTDSYAGSLGQACVGGTNPTSFTYQRTIAVPANDCQSYGNTATFTANDSGATGSASKTVTVCGPARTGALTMGFWKNTNGQNLIKTYCVRGSYSLGAYLVGLGGGSGPFANAPTACGSLATYVYNILNGASATDMNRMLKAQMLASALDVWFSGPGWTSTTLSKVKPPSTFLSHDNLGTFKVDTTAVCPMVDTLSTGTASCKNNRPSTNAVAAGALPSSPMTVQAILDFAATTPSPFNGSTSSSVWYGGDRTKQEILKNVFDQFNNQDAFGSF